MKFYFAFISVYGTCDLWFYLLSATSRYAMDQFVTVLPPLGFSDSGFVKDEKD